MEFADRFEVPKITVKTELIANGGEDVDALVVKMLVRSELVKGLLSRFWIVLAFEARLKFESDGGTDVGARVVSIFPQGQFFRKGL